MSQQGLRQASVRAVTGSAESYEGDWHRLFTRAGIPAGTFNERLLRWINLKLSWHYTVLSDAQNALAAAFGAASFASLGTFNAETFDIPIQLDFSDPDQSGYLAALAA